MQSWRDGIVAATAALSLRRCRKTFGEHEVVAGVEPATTWQASPSWARVVSSACCGRIEVTWGDGGNVEEARNMSRARARTQK